MQISKKSNTFTSLVQYLVRVGDHKNTSSFLYLQNKHNYTYTNTVKILDV